MKRWLYVAVLGLGASTAQAQLNESDTTRLQVRMSLTGNEQTGNVRVRTLRNRLDISLSPTRNWVFKSQNASLYQSFFGVKVDNDLFSRNYMYLRPQQQAYPFAIGYVSTNYRRKVDVRYVVGAGGTVQLWNHRPNVLKLSLGVVYENSQFAGSTYNSELYNGSRSISLWRATTWLGGWHTLAGNRLRLYYDAYWQPAFSDARNYRWQVDVGVDLTLWHGLSLTALYTLTHENVVIATVQTNDRLLTVGLTYNLRKNHQHP